MTVEVSLSVFEGGIPDVEQAARTVLQDWNSGRIPFFVSPPEMEEKNDETNVVSKFSEAFDIEALLNENYNRALQQVPQGKFVEVQRVEVDNDVEMEN